MDKVHWRGKTYDWISRCWGEKENGKVKYFIGKGIERIFQTTTLGEYNGKRTTRVDILIKEFSKCGIPTVFCSDMDAWQKTHVAIIISIADALYGYECNNYKLARSYNSVKQMVKGMKEGFKVIEKCGLKVTPSKLCFLKLPTVILTIAFSLYMNTELAELGMAKHSIAAKDENIDLQNEFDELIRKAGIKTPAIYNLRKNLLK